MIRIETTQGTPARRGFVDAEAAERVIDRWDDAYEPLLDVLAQSQPIQIMPDGSGPAVRSCAGTAVAVDCCASAGPSADHGLGASSKLAQHLIAHPEHS